MNAPARGATSPWPIMLAAGAILMITFGARGASGLFISPINTSTGLGIERISLAYAVGQLVWGLVQPVFGALADRTGPVRVIAAGALLLAGGMALTPFMTSSGGLIFAVGILTAAGAGAGSFSILLAAGSQRLAADRRAFAGGFINAGGSFGQFVFAKLTQTLIEGIGWINAMFVVASTALLTIPLALPLRRQAAPPRHGPAHKPPSDGLSLREQLRVALRDRSYLLLHAGFFTCGFHIAFLVTHLPGEVALCGLPAAVAATSLGLIGLFNIAGSLTAGALGSRYRMKYLLAWMYASRAVIIAVYLVTPKTALTFYVFAATLGFTWLATVPPTAGLVSKMFGLKHLGALFGLTLVSHQVGGFLGAYLGGVARAQSGDYHWMWYADMVLAIGAALVNLPIREAAPRRLVARAA